MRTLLNENLRGLKRAEAQVNLAASRIARWGVEPSTPDTAGVTPINPEGDELQFDGVARPRDVLNQPWGREGLNRGGGISLGDEALRLKAGEWAFRANIAATRSVLDLEASALKIFDSESSEDQ